MTAPKHPALTPAEVNHLRRLVAWVQCEIGQAPEEMVPMVRDMAEKLGGLTPYGQAAMVQAHAEAVAVPKYVRAAVKALRKTLAARPDGIDDAEIVEPATVMLPGAPRALPAPRCRQKDTECHLVAAKYRCPMCPMVADTEGGSHD